MSDSSADRNPLDQIAEEFVARLRTGQRPALTEYTSRHPELAEEIRDLFPALVEMEQLKPVSGDQTGAFTPPAEPTDPLRVGEFRILRRVGQGGMGVVYEAVQESLGRHVALKLLPAEALVDPKRLERFRREARAAARLHHTNIVPVFGVGESDGRHFFAMQFISGHPLDAVIEEVRRLKEKSVATRPADPRAVSEVAAALMTGTFAKSASAAESAGAAAVASTMPYDATPAPAAAALKTASGDSSPALSGSISEGGRHYWSTVARIGVQVADGLAYAHGQGILHRDIKPANLLLDLLGTVWITDFGLAKATDADDLTHAGDVVGTLRYMAPERFDGSGDHRADIYALGLTLYELLTLKPAYGAENRARLVQEVTAANPPKPRSINPLIPRDLETIVLKAIARDPAMRYQSATELAEDLRRFTEDRPIRARRASSTEQAWRWCRRNPAVASLVTAVLMVFAAGAALAGFFAVRADTLRVRAEQGEQEANGAQIQANEARIRANNEAEKVRSEQKFTRHLLYNSQMNHAAVALNEGRIPRVLEILGQTTPKPEEQDLRGWEWHYLDRLIRGESRIVPLELPPSTPPRPFSFELSGNGLRLLGIRGDGEGLRLDVWDTTTGRLVNQIPKAGKPSLPGKGFRTTIAILSLDGGQLAHYQPLSFQANEPSDPENPPGKLRMWNVDSGEELPSLDLGVSVVPDHQGGNRLSVISIESGGVRWLDSSSPPFPPRGKGAEVPPAPTELAEKPEPSQPPEYIARYWDRASGHVASHRFRPGDGTGATSTAFLGKSRDGRIVLFHLHRPDPSKPPLGTRPVARDEEPVPLECWDVAATPPQRVWSKSVPARSALNFGGGVSTLISPTGKMVAVPDDKGVTVYRTEARAGEPVIEWQAELPPGTNEPRKRGGFEFHTLSAVFDDGRLLIYRPGGGAILSPDTDVDPILSQRLNPPATRQTVMYTTYQNWGREVQMTEDGKTLVEVDQLPGVRLWNLDGTIPPRLRRSRSEAITSPDGRLTVEQPPRDDPFEGGGPRVTVKKTKETDKKTLEDDILVKDAATGEIRHRIAVPAGSNPYSTTTQFAASSRRLLVQFSSRSAVGSAGSPGMGEFKRGYFAQTWELYDTDNWCRVAQGEWKRPAGQIRPGLSLSPAGRWFVQGSMGDSELSVRDALTGQVTCEVHLAEGTVIGAYKFNPAADRFAVTTVPSNLTNDRAATKPGSGPFELRLLDPATGERIWKRTTADVCTRTPDGFGGLMADSLFQLLFIPSGRLLVGFREPTESVRVWVVRAETGEIERTLAKAFELSAATEGVPIGLMQRMSVDRDGRRVAVIDGGEVRVWDLETGALLATLRGHDSPISSVAMSPDGTRLFTLGSVYSLAERVAVRVGIWDLETSRLVFTLQPPVSLVLSRTDSRFGITTSDPGKIEFRDGLLSVVRYPANYKFDGAPLKRGP